MPKLSYIVCSSPRSGSSLLCEALKATGIAGRPDEYGNPFFEEEIFHARKLGIRSEAEYMQRIIDVSTTANGVFGTKLHAFYTPFFLQKINVHKNTHFTSFKEGLESEFPNLRYIFITREDKVAQAISYYRALMTGEWWRWSGEEPPSHAAHVPFDQLGIKKCLQLIEAMDTYWNGYFETYHVEPLRLTFDNIAEDYERTVREALQFLGLPHTDAIPPRATQRIANDQSKKWAETFRTLEEAAPFVTSLPATYWASY